MQKKNPSIHGFSLIEIVVAIAIVGVVTLGVGVLLANGQTNWRTLTERVYGDAAVDSFAAQKAFDTVCRKASLRKYTLSEDADALELYYWDDRSGASTPENYARFYQQGNTVFVEYGKTQSGSWSPDTEELVDTVKLAEGIQSLTFSVQGTSVQMFLNYTDATLMPVVCSSVRHNQ
jgi:prepilin-type N-terminal cleavage/methylation domain-containing protein